MKTCPRCHWEYPDHFLQPLVSNLNVIVVCAICALEVSNEVHGISTRKKFTGPKAEQLRQETLRWRKTYRKD